MRTPGTPSPGLSSNGRDVVAEGTGLWFATELGVDYPATGATPCKPCDDVWIHFDELDAPNLTNLHGALLDANGIKYS